MKAGRNRTIDISIDEGREYLERCLRLSAPADAQSVLGRTIVGDTLEVMPLLPRGFVDLAIIDPPYNLYKDFGGKSFKAMGEEAYEAYTEEWLLRLLPLMKKTGSIYVCCDWQCSSAICRVLAKHLHIRNRITWQREKGRGSKTNWKNCSEDIWFATVSDDYTFNPEAVKQRRRVIAPYRNDGAPKDWEETAEGNFRNSFASNFWDDISIPYWSMPENTAHPTQKPEKLLAKLILASSNAGDVVFDPFLGSGSTAVTAKKLERQYLGIEQNEQYCLWAEKRLEMAETDKSIQGYADGVFWERNTAALQKKYK